MPKPLTPKQAKKKWHQLAQPGTRVRTKKPCVLGIIRARHNGVVLSVHNDMVHVALDNDVYPLRLRKDVALEKLVVVT